MRVLAGAIGVVSLAVTVAVAQERAAVFKAPEAVRAGDVPVVARGAGEPFPPSPNFGSTPIPNAKAAGARPAGNVSWMTGVDPNLIPAAGTASRANAVRPLTPPTGIPKDDMAQPKVFDRIKGAVLGNDKAAPPKELPKPLGTPAQQPQQQPPTAASPFRGTGANGAPVFAGPPAYRWYGWGTVTPGANPLAPAGQYPRASANWYQITGATPGAFPVPVSNGAPIILGSDPPTYGLARTQPGAQPVVPVATQPTYTPPVYQEQPRYTPPPAPSKFLPGPPAAPSVPTISAPTVLPKPVAAAPTVPAPPAISAPVVEPKPQPVTKLPPLPPVPAPTGPVAVVPSVVPSVLPTVEAPGEPKPLETAPPTLPPSVTETPAGAPQNWTPPSQPAKPAPGQWSPAADAQPLPTVSPDDQIGRAPGKPIVARGQINENNADPLAALIKQVCQGRADGVEVRYTGTKKMQVCFEIRGAAEAQKLVNDISKRPELTAYQIDFCVFVK